MTDSTDETAGLSTDDPDDALAARTADDSAGPGPGIDGYNAGYAELLLERRLRERGLVPPSLAEWPGNGAWPAGVSRAADVSAETSGGPTVPAAPAVAARSAERLRAAAIAGQLVKAIRDLGHLAVRLDPLGSPPPGHPSLNPGFHGISEEDLAALPASALELERMGDTALDAIARLRKIYCGSIGYELDHMENPAQRDWLLDYIESGRHFRSPDPAASRTLLERLTHVEGLERFLHRSYLGKKRFSIEGLDMLVPMLDESLRRAAGDGMRQALLGMAHRGRLNVLAHVIGRSYESIVAEFEGEVAHGLQTTVPETGSGDVKYHIGARGTFETGSGTVEIALAPNPSHLEHVNPVVEGMARATRDRLRRENGEPAGGRERGAMNGGAGDLGKGVATDDGREVPGGGRRAPTPNGATRSSAGGGPASGPRADGSGRTRVLPILIHGDASFMGQGVVAETLNLCRLEGYETGGTLHFIANNQLGFTTTPEEGRSTRYASDLALGFRIPVLHVNADDPEACLAAVQLAVDYRDTFGEDILIDLVGYRRYGHNEGDEPGYTQPLMYAKIAEQPSVRAQLAERLVAEGVLTQQDADAMEERVAARLAQARDAVVARGDGSADAGGGEGADPGTGDSRDGATSEVRRSTHTADAGGAGETEPAALTEASHEPDIETGVPQTRLEELNEALHRWPDDFDLFRKLGRQMQRRRDALHERIDWAHAESLAYASLLTDGIPIRLTGEDTERATFSQRHLVLHDAEDGSTYTPLAHLSPDQAQVEVLNSPLSEVAALGFEYGFSTVNTGALVLWEAQFGDFANVAQAIIDQFVVAGRSKWGQESRLVLLLPHAYEGQGPEHSSARLERFLQLAAEDNIRVANCTTPAQYFHLLRLQALRRARRPLVVMTPKSLLRHPAARSTLAELAEGRFQPVLVERAVTENGDTTGDGTDGERANGEVRRVIACSGKIYYDLAGSKARERAGDRVAILRVERLYPVPRAELEAAMRLYPSAEELVWAQEEPANMGAWSHIAPTLRAVAAQVEYVGRPGRASPAEGYAAAHEEEQERIVEAAFAGM